MLNHHNFDYDALIPLFVNDRYYGQDKIRDFWFLLSKLGQFALGNGTTAIRIEGSDVTQNTVTSVDIPPQYGFANYNVEVIDTFGLPPTKQTQAIGVPILSTQTNAFDLSTAGATLDGSTINYLKMAYAETDGASRNRAKGAGTYAYEKVPSFTFTCNSTVPTQFEVEVAQIVGDGVGALIITMNYDAPIKNLFPIGSYYTQYPDASSNDLSVAFPITQEPAMLFGGVWAKIFDTEGVDFHTEGYDGAGRTAGLMNDEMQTITGFAVTGVVGTFTSVGGAFTQTVSNIIIPATQPGTANTTLSFSSANSTAEGGARTGSRTSDRNRLMKVWKRTG